MERLLYKAVEEANVNAKVPEEWQRFRLVFANKTMEYIV